MATGMRALLDTVIQALPQVKRSAEAESRPMAPPLLPMYPFVNALALCYMALQRLGFPGRPDETLRNVAPLRALNKNTPDVVCYHSHFHTTLFSDKKKTHQKL